MDFVFFKNRVIDLNVDQRLKISFHSRRPFGNYEIGLLIESPPGEAGFSPPFLIIVGGTNFNLS